MHFRHCNMPLLRILRLNKKSRTFVHPSTSTKLININSLDCFFSSSVLIYSEDFGSLLSVINVTLDRALCIHFFEKLFLLLEIN